MRVSLFLRVDTQTPPVEARAWGDFDYFGKVRMSDGLVVLSRKPVRLFVFSLISLAVMEVEEALTFFYRWVMHQVR